MDKTVDKSVVLDLVGTNANAFAIMGKFSSEARKQGWTKEEVDLVLEEATSSDYDHLLATIILHCDGEAEEEI